MLQELQIRGPCEEHMRRRGFIALLGGTAITWPLAARAQPAGRAFQIGILTLGVTGPRATHWWQPFIDELRELHYVEGNNLLITYLGADAQPERLPALAADLVKAKMDVIVTTGVRETLAASRATSSIPVVFTVVADPVGQGVVTNLARPESNVTGLASIAPGLYQKYVELLLEVVPSATRFAIVGAPFASSDLRPEVDKAGSALGVTVFFVPVAGPDEFDAALAAAKRDGAAGVIVLSDALTLMHSQRFVQLALNYRLPGVYWDRSYVEAGGLMSYSADFTVLRRRAAYYVDKILKGAKPRDLPVEQPTKFQLTVNLKTAKALGLTVSPTLLARADEVVE
jgi:putative tryptophan/tyrosine transport system substrate-binding protein